MPQHKSWPVEVRLWYRGFTPKLLSKNIAATSCSAKAARSVARSMTRSFDNEKVPRFLDYNYSVVYLKKGRRFRCYEGRLDQAGWLSVQADEIIRETIAPGITDMLPKLDHCFAAISSPTFSLQNRTWKWSR